MGKRKLFENDPNLKGTLISVLALGIFIIVMWFGAYALYLTR